MSDYLTTDIAIHGSFHMCTTKYEFVERREATLEALSFLLTTTTRDIFYGGHFHSIPPITTHSLEMSWKA